MTKDNAASSEMSAGNHDPAADPSGQPTGQTPGNPAGRQAATPMAIPPKDWWGILRRVSGRFAARPSVSCKDAVMLQHECQPDV